MTKKQLAPGIVNFPMPMTIIGVKVNGKNNFMPAAWVSMVSYAPPKLAVTLGNHHYTNKGIKENGVFSVNFPSIKDMQQVDYCGLVSGAKTDKSKAFPVFYGASENAPLLQDFKLTVECKLDKIIVNGQNETFIGDIIHIFADEDLFVHGKLDLQKLDPLILGQTNTTYYRLGEVAGPAWKIGLQK
jgi:flavin reductase (DIM6/NTAB) family NADH-FMN oxidoreductase RutF